MPPLSFSKEIPSFKKDFAPYLKLVSFSSEHTSADILETFTNSSNRLTKAHQLVISGLILTFPSVMQQQVTQLPDAMKKVVEHCEINSNTVELSYLNEAHRLLRQLSSEWNRKSLNLRLTDPRAERAAQNLKPALDLISESTLNHWQASILNILSVKAPQFAKTQRDAYDLNQEVFSELQAEVSQHFVA